MSTLAKHTALILRNDLRLLWREIRTGKLRIAANLALFALVLLVLHAVSLLVFFSLKQPPPLPLEAGLWAFFAFLMLGTSMNQAIGLFFERADFDLLLASPVPTRAVLLARIAVMSTGAFLGAGVFLLPLIDGAVIGFSLKYFSGYAVWSLLAIIAACCGVWLTLALVRWLGARRARTWVQVLAAVLGASVYLSFQVQHYLAPSGKAALWSAMRATAEWLGFSHLARAARSEPLPLLVLCGAAALAAFATARLLAHTFLSGLQESSSRPARRVRAGQKIHRLRAGLFRATWRKDLRLIARDPLLLSQYLPSLMYILPVFISFRKFGGPTVLAPVAIVIAAQFSALLSDAAAAGEEALDLIRASPSSEKRLRIAKAAAGMTLPLAASLLICVVIVALGRPWVALATLFTSAMTAAGCAWLSVARVVPTRRQDLLSRGRRRMPVARSIAIGALILTASGGISLVAHGTLWFIGLLALGTTALGVIACFTFVEVEEIDFEKTPSPWTAPNASTS